MTLKVSVQYGDVPGVPERVELEWAGEPTAATVTTVLDRLLAAAVVATSSPQPIESTVLRELAESGPNCRRFVCGHPLEHHRSGPCTVCATPMKCKSFVGLNEVVSS